MCRVSWIPFVTVGEAGKGDDTRYGRPKLKSSRVKKIFMPCKNCGKVCDIDNPCPECGQEYKGNT